MKQCLSCSYLLESLPSLLLRHTIWLQGTRFQRFLIVSLPPEPAAASEASKDPGPGLLRGSYLQRENARKLYTLCHVRTCCSRLTLVDENQDSIPSILAGRPSDHY